MEVKQGEVGENRLKVGAGSQGQLWIEMEAPSSGSLLRWIVPAVIVSNRSHVRTTSASFYSTAAPVTAIHFAGAGGEILRRIC